MGQTINQRIHEQKLATIILDGLEIQKHTNTYLVLSERGGRGVREVSLALEAAQQEHGEHCPVEDVSHLAPLVVVNQVVVVPVVAGDVGLLLLLGLAAGLVVRLKQVPVVLEPLQRLLRDGPEERIVQIFLVTDNARGVFSDILFWHLPIGCPFPWTPGILYQ